MTGDGSKRQEVDLGSRPQVAAVARELVRLIHVEGLRSGDQLPSQAELRLQRGFHNNTLSAAMKVLVDCGVITRRVKVGTMVVEAERPVPGLWRVGLALMPAVAEQMFYAQLVHLLQVQLQQAGASVLLYMEEREKHDPERIIGFGDFTDLAETCAAGLLDGVISPLRIDGEDWRAWHAKGLEVMHVGAWEEAPCGVVIEQERMVAEAVPMLLSRGCRRLAVVAIGPPKRGHERYWTSFQAACGRAGLAVDDCRSLSGGEGPFGGWRVANQLLAMAAERRPQGLIVLDDRMATGMTAVLAANGESYNPEIIVQTNLQAPLAFALPVIHYQVDVAELARRAAANLISRLRNPHTAPQREWFYPELHSDQPIHMVSLTAGREGLPSLRPIDATMTPTEISAD